MADKKAFTTLKERVIKAGGIEPVGMWELRDAAGYTRLGVHVVRDIAGQLLDHGLATLPDIQHLHPTDAYNQLTEVRVFAINSRVGRIINAVLRPTEDNDNLLREAGADDIAETLNRIRVLVSGR